MKLENLRIIVDERERKSGIPELLKSIGMGVEMKTLPIGDYIVAPETIVERKSIKDLMASVSDPHSNNNNTLFCFVSTAIQSTYRL